MKRIVFFQSLIAIVLIATCVICVITGIKNLYFVEIEVIDLPTSTQAIELTNSIETMTDLVINSTNELMTEVMSQSTTVLELETESEVVTLLTLAEIYERYNMTEDAIILAKIMYSEAGVVKSTTERACVAWTVLNRVDKYGTSIKHEVTRPAQFAWHEDAKVLQELLDLAYDIIARWYYEKETGQTNGRVLPANYYFFYGDGRHNHFFATWDERKARVNEWDYSLSSPYEN